ncbi:MAG: NAD(P)H-dependent oxidoreductase [Bacteroidetes bacterium]|nr:NAD(P)H-dependent oxidoreductase [Bacteroidota bacterium]
MSPKKKIFAIIGSASENSSNLKLVENLAAITQNDLDYTIFNELKKLPPFDPELSLDQAPEIILDFRKSVQNADGILVCTPEYIFSIPSGLKNALEWCVSTTVFSDKPAGLITASAHGQKGHDELQLIMNTLMARFTPETTLLIQGIKGKINTQGEITNTQTQKELTRFANAFHKLVKTSTAGTDA